MKLQKDEIRTLVSAPLTALRLLFDKQAQKSKRETMPGISDSAIFYRLWSLVNTFTEDRTLSLFSEDELKIIQSFKNKFESLNWVTLKEYDYIKELEKGDISCLKEEGFSLYNLLQNKLKELKLT